MSIKTMSLVVQLIPLEMRGSMQIIAVKSLLQVACPHMTAHP